MNDNERGVIENPAYDTVQEINFEKLCDFTPVSRGGPMEDSGIKQIRPIFVSKFKQAVNTIRRYKDTENNIVYGIPIKKRPDGTYLFKKLMINEYGMYDLKDKMQAMEFHVLKTAPFMKDSPFNKNGTPAIYYVHDEEENAKAAIQQRKKTRQAEEFLDSLLDSQIIDYGRVFKIDPQRNSAVVIRNLLAEKAAKKPETILALFLDAVSTQASIVFQRSKATGLISETDMGLKTHNGYTLGMTEQTAVMALAKNEALLRTLDAESKKREKDASISAKKVTIATTLQQSIAQTQANNPNIDSFLEKNKEILSQSAKDPIDDFKTVIPTKEELQRAEDDDDENQEPKDPNPFEKKTPQDLKPKPKKQ